MGKIRLWIALGCCIVGTAAIGQAQIKQQPGLWESTSTMTMAGMPQMPQLPPGTQLPPGVQMPQGPFGGPHTTQVCVTQAMIDRFGGPYSNPPRGDCQATNRSLTPTGMTLTMSCTGQFTGTGAMEMTWTDPGATQAKIHLVGTAQGGNGSHPIDMTMQIRSVYKGSDCGSVKPLPMPVEK
jgi:hypothetical protein